MNTALTVSNVSLTFRKRSFFKKAAGAYPVLHNVSLTVKKGEALGVIGSNGAGKSTLLRIMAGILSPDAGTVESHGMSTALLTLSGGIFPECSGWDNVVMLLMLQQDVSRKEAEALVPSIAEFAELEYAIHAPMRTYSSGMLSRLKFAIAIQANPDILLVDEVLAVGDAPFATKSMDAMRRKLSSGGTVIFVSHSLYDVYTYCTRAIWIEKGVIMAEGNAKDTVQVYRRYCVAQGAEVFDPSVWAEFWEERKMSGTR